MLPLDEQHLKSYESAAGRRETEDDERPVEYWIEGGKIPQLFERFGNEEIAEGLETYLKTRDVARLKLVSSILSGKAEFTSWLRSKKYAYLHLYEILFLDAIESLSLESLRTRPQLIDEIAQGYSFLSSMRMPLAEAESALYKKMQEVSTQFDLKTETEIFVLSYQTSSPMQVPLPARIPEMLMKLADQIPREKSLAILESYFRTLSVGIESIVKPQTAAGAPKKSYRFDSPTQAAQILGTFYFYVYPQLLGLRSSLRGGSIPKAMFDRFKEGLDRYHAGLLDDLRKSGTI
ncbi:MAG: hypothetical protein NTU41_01140 [Chloroflexi bacterium]|nr:hypothetical protein [Chloroflexota bacterium]